MKIKFTFILMIFIGLIEIVHAKQSIEANPIEILAKQLETHKGKVVYIDFWASWCIPCRKSFPWMNKLQQKYQTQGLEIISINLDHDRNLADEFLKQNAATFSVIYDAAGLIARKYKLKGMPSSFIIDRTGRLASAHVGFNKEKSLAYEQEIKQLLATSKTNKKP